MTPALRRLLLFGLLAAWVPIARYASFAYAIADQDEAYYLLHGGLWMQGIPPYTAVWDVKPPGLLLIFGLFSLFGSAPVLAARIGTSVAVLLGALALHRFADRHLPGRHTKLLAAFLYPPFTAVLWGVTSPPEPFLLPPVILGLDLAFGWRSGATVRAPWSCFSVGLLFGLAVLVKQTAVFEFALAAWYAAAAPFRRPDLGALALLLAGAALPSLAFLAYEFGVGVDLVTALTPFVSAAQRLGGDGISFGGGLLRFLPMLKPVLPLFAGGLFCFAIRRELARAERFAGVAFVGQWFLASAAGIVAMRSMYAHYYLTLVPPAVLASAIWLDWIAERLPRLALPAIALALAAYPMAYAPLFEIRDMRPGDLPDLAAAALEAAGMRPGDTLYIVDQDPMIYSLTKARIPTRYAFSQHLMCDFQLPDRGQDDEVRRIMASRPRFVLVDHDRQWMLCEVPHRERFAAIDEWLQRDYALASTVDGIRESVDIYRRKEPP
jgi:hypothetical protein